MQILTQIREMGGEVYIPGREKLQGEALNTDVFLASSYPKSWLSYSILFGPKNLSYALFKEDVCPFAFQPFSFLVMEA